MGRRRCLDGSAKLSLPDTTPARHRCLAYRAQAEAMHGKAAQACSDCTLQSESRLLLGDDGVPLGIGGGSLATPADQSRQWQLVGVGLKKP
ncbi:hypothetical protein Cni_G20274 [Canna indica]|uniref:Uncharacterized protein n=1 Tax=Canna indica TaxID=4628 RepID=A0AAQ3QG18_9LILI|nr:hypothetical protein Cni_G20274 [Canna indica]